MHCLFARFAVAALLVVAASAAYDPALIVEDIAAGCPVANVPWPASQYSMESLIATFAPLATQIARAECQQQATSLATCALDGSLGVQSGCCSTACAGAMEQLRTLNCFEDIIQTVCGAAPEQQVQALAVLPVLTSAADRCINYQVPASVTCPDGRVLTTVSPQDLVEPMALNLAVAETPMPEVAVPLTETLQPVVVTPAVGAPVVAVPVVPAADAAGALNATNTTNSTAALP